MWGGNHVVLVCREQVVVPIVRYVALLRPDHSKDVFWQQRFDDDGRDFTAPSSFFSCIASDQHQLRD